MPVLVPGEMAASAAKKRKVGAGAAQATDNDDAPWRRWLGVPVPNLLENASVAQKGVLVQELYQRLRAAAPESA